MVLVLKPESFRIFDSEDYEQGEHPLYPLLHIYYSLAKQF